tara:strand:- start:6 stop:1901 length:1896 start_codon:yes stop_codon:yes gene_type:complete
MATRWAIASGAFSSTATWNDGGTLGIPTTGDDVFTNGFTVNMDVNATVNSMNNSARARDIATPAMTANNAPSPYVAAASSTVDSTQPFQAFDRNYASTTFWSSNPPTQWLSMDFGSSIVIDAYTIFGSNDQTLNTRNWTFEGSNNNSTWTVLQTVALPSAIAGSSSYSSGSIGNVTGYRYYRVNITLNGGGTRTRITELELYQPGTAALASGGSFNFNTAGVSVTCTSTSASLSAGATNLITVTATTGTVTLNLGSATTTSFQCFSHTGACNFTLNGVRYISTATNASCIGKSSSGTITITGDIFGSAVSNANSAHGLNSSNGNTVVIGNVFGGTALSGITCHGINQPAGNVTVTGNVVGGTGASYLGINLTGAASQFTINGNVTGGSGASAHGINFSGTLGTVNGNVTGGGGTSANGVLASAGGVNVTGTITGAIGIGLLISTNSTIVGNVFAGSAAGIRYNSAANNIVLNVTGDVYSSNIANGIQLDGTGTQVVNLTGNMYNTLGRMAIWCPNVFISDTATTLWRMDTGGGAYKFLYSADTTPNLPATTNVRSGATFGPALSLTGTMVVPATSDVRENVPVDNTVGTGELTSADIINGINASSDSLAVRLKNILTDQSAGNIISQYKNS